MLTTAIIDILTCSQAQFNRLLRLRYVIDALQEVKVGSRFPVKVEIRFRLLDFSKGHEGAQRALKQARIMSELCNLNVGGGFFTTSKATLMKVTYWLEFADPEQRVNSVAIWRQVNPFRQLSKRLQLLHRGLCCCLINSYVPDGCIRAEHCRLDHTCVALLQDSDSMLARMFSSAWSSNKTDAEVRRICRCWSFKGLARVGIRSCS